MIVYIGSYTDATHPRGLHTVDVDTETGAMTRIAAYEAENPLYLARSGGVLYANWKEGLKSFRIDGRALTPIDEVALGGRAMCHVAVTPDGGRVTWAAYLSGLAGQVAVADGRFGAVTKHTHRGRGPNLPRQDAAHPHCAVPTPDGRGFAVCDLGMDTITVYPRGNVFPTTPAGAGPRHILFHPNGRLAFVVFELGNLLGVYEWTSEGGLGKLLDQQRTTATWPTGRGNNGDLCAALRFSPDGRRIVISNRGEQSLVTYDFDAASGKLKFVSRTILQGSWPRDFVFLTDTCALVTMERSHEIHTLRYDAAAGTFTTLKTLDGFYRPVCVAF